MDYEIMMNEIVRLGQQAPEFEADTTMGRISLNDYRGKEYGVSEALLQNFEKKLIENKIKSYTLSVYKDNGRARNFYLKNGMKCIAEHDSSAIYIKTC